MAFTIPLILVSVMSSFHICAGGLTRSCDASDSFIARWPGVHIHSGNALVMNFTGVDFDNKNQFRFDFKTGSPDGDIFYGRFHRRSSDYMRFYLSNGQLLREVRCKDEHTLTPLGTSRFDDNLRHTVQYMGDVGPGGQESSLRVDDVQQDLIYNTDYSRLSSVQLGGARPGGPSEATLDVCIGSLSTTAILLDDPAYAGFSMCIPDE